MTKITKTYSIDEGTYRLFEQACKKNNINKSSYIENCIKKYLRDNLGYDDEELYYLRENENYVVTITDRDDTYFQLSDGSTIPQILFYQTFKQVEKVDPERFFGVNKTPVEKMQELARETFQRNSNTIKQIKIEEQNIPNHGVDKGPDIDKNQGK